MTKHRCAMGIVVGWILLLANAATAQAADVVEQRANDVAGLIRADPGGYDALFQPAFLTAVPPAKLTALFNDLHTQLGACRSVEITDRIGPRAAKVNFVFDAFVVPGTISVEAGAKHLIDGLFFQPPAPTVKDFVAIIKSMRALPGTTSFLLVKLGADKPQPMASLNPDQPMAIGSTFKLYILSELVRQITAGQRHWEDVVKLDAATMSMPSGTLQTWPVGSPVTVHTLAALMISQSDNTATDHLLHLVGREKVEAMLAPAGNEHAAKDKPFLSTLEMFKLHCNPRLGDAFIAGDEAARRKMLSAEVMDAKVDLSGITPTPGRIEQIEWFASTADLCRVMDYLRRHTESGPASEARKILAINPGLQIDKSRFPIVCYKGGSEAGVLNLTFLLQSRSGQWYAMSATWNNPKAAVKDTDLFSCLEQAFRIIEP